MIKPKSFIISLLILLFYCDAYSQNHSKKQNTLSRASKQEIIFDNVNYIHQIKSVTTITAEKQNELPVYTLGTDEKIVFSFDDLRADNRTIYYSIEHCNADWTSSQLNPMDYIVGYNESRVDNFQASQNTLVSYSHYSFIFPNEYVQPKLAGNYLLKVYEDADVSRLLFTRRIYVVKSASTVDAAIFPSFDTKKKHTNQKLNVTVKSAIEIVNPSSNVQLYVLQNQRNVNKMILMNPSKIESNTLTYSHPQTLDFEGNNEFRTLDLRSVRNASSQVTEIKLDSSFHALLYTDEDNSKVKYSSLADENGRFFIRNNDVVEQANIQSDYINVTFSLNTSTDMPGDIHLVGGFNDFKINPSNQLKFNAVTANWETTQILKQGIYNYEYYIVKNKKTETSKFSGSHFETGNEYQILVYYRSPGTFWDEIIGYNSTSINTYKK